MENRSYAYFLIFESTVFEELRVGLARTFPPHITLKGRFSATDDPIPRLVDLGREVLSPFRAVRSSLEGPVTVDSELVWYELTKSSAGFTQVFQMHVALEERVPQATLLTRDYVPFEFKFEGYKPHATIAFSSPYPRSLALLPSRIDIVTTNWAVYEYVGIQADSPAHAVHVEALTI